MPPSCRLCANTQDHRLFTAQEMMFGTREPFDYFECGQCHSLQIVTVPNDLARHYPPDYYSLGGRSPDYLKKWSVPLKRWFKQQRMGHSLGQRTVLGALLQAIAGPHPLAHWFKSAGIHLEERLLDVGCGGGDLLLRLYMSGFTDLTGIDPHIAVDRTYHERVRVIKGRLEDLTGPFDLIMMHHSLEHFIDPAATLRIIHQLLAPSGTALIRLPVADCWAWRTYGPDWVQLDAPRHLLLPSREGMRLMAEQSGFTIIKTSFDATAFMILGSEQYRRGIALRQAESYYTHPAASPFTPAQVKQWEAEAARLNQVDDGDQACFYLKKNGE